MIKIITAKEAKELALRKMSTIIDELIAEFNERLKNQTKDLLECQIKMKFDGKYHIPAIKEFHKILKDNGYIVSAPHPQDNVDPYSYSIISWRE